MTAERLNQTDLLVGDRWVARDAEGYLLTPTDWDESVAEAIATELELELTPERWMVVNFVHDWFMTRQAVPEARHALKALKTLLGPERATRRFLYQLFPYGYGQQACKIAGMRKPLKLMLDV
ncbi:MAG: TusE/DsrC/DsvC family sulfur relay protein [Gammaproteobacteria bacterium]